MSCYEANNRMPRCGATAVDDTEPQLSQVGNPLPTDPDWSKA